MILIDNYDSFTYNIVEYFRILGKHIQVIKNDEMTIEDFDKLNFNSIILSPGPSNPSNAGITMDIIKKYHKEKQSWVFAWDIKQLQNFLVQILLKLKSLCMANVQKYILNKMSHYLMGLSKVLKQLDIIPWLLKI